MIKPGKSILLILLVVCCVEPYEFVIQNKGPKLVVEGYISDKSFDETLLYPSDGRYFTIKLSYTGDVINHRPEMATGALVRLVNDQGEAWSYLEVGPGVYKLFNVNFKALINVKYQLRISLENKIYESSWEELPPTDPPPMGEIDFEEIEKDTYVYEAGEKVIRKVKGILTNVSVPSHLSEEPFFYRWKFTPTWIYTAPLSPSVVTPGHTCWAESENYLKDYALQIDNVGGYKKDLFFLPTIRNERIFEKLSVLVTQYSVQEKAYFFWKEMLDQNIGYFISASPPFNLMTNIICLDNEEETVSGYFSVVHEQAKRWYFDKSQLSYTVLNTLRGDCIRPNEIGPLAPQCYDCREYSNGIATEAKPVWWEN